MWNVLWNLSGKLRGPLASCLAFSRSSRRETVAAGCLLGAVVMLPSMTYAQGLLSPACNFRCDRILETCSLTDVACHTRNAGRAGQVADCNARQAVCMTKLGLYNTYMGQLGLGVALHSLPALYRDLFASRYPGVSMNGVRIGFSDRQASFAITDCTTIYFRDNALLGRIRDASLTADNEIRVLLHELQHVRQCAEIGGRDFYAERWFRELEVTFIQNANLETLHNRMPMEADAATRANQVLGELGGCCRAGSGALLRPLTVSSLTPNLSSPQTFRVGLDIVWTAAVTGGSAARQFEFSTRRTDGAFAVERAFGSIGSTFTWRPPAAGSYEIRVRVREPGSSLAIASRTASFSIILQLRVPTIGK